MQLPTIKDKFYFVLTVDMPKTWERFNKWLRDVFYYGKFLIVLLFSIQVNAQTLLHTESFGTSGSCAYNTGYWSAGSSFFTSANYTPTTSAQRYMESPASPDGSCFLNSFIPSGTDETIPARVQKDESYTERYVEFYMYFKSPFFYPAGLKIARFGRGAGSGSTAFFEYNWNSGSPGIVFYTYNHVNDAAWVGNISYTFTEDTWHKIGLHFKESDNGVSNGFFKLYINDVLTINSGNITTRTNTNNKDFFWIGGNNSWGSAQGEGGTTTASGNSALYFDGIKVYNGFPAQSALSARLKRARFGQMNGQESGQK